jgi:hypothetical protein
LADLRDDDLRQIVRRVRDVHQVRLVNRRLNRLVLECVSYVVVRGPSDVHPIAPFAFLRDLVLCWLPAVVDSVSQARGLQHLTRLDLMGHDFICDGDAIPPFTLGPLGTPFPFLLRRLTLGLNPCLPLSWHEDCGPAITSMPHLTALDIKHEVTWLEGATRLRLLDAPWTDGMGALSRLEWLRINDYDDPERLTQLCGLTRLRALEVNKLAPCLDAISTLTGLTRLIDVKRSGDSAIQDASRLRVFTALRKIELHVKLAAMAPLFLPTLVDVELAWDNDPLDHVDCAAAVRCCTRLRRLVMPNTPAATFIGESVPHAWQLPCTEVFYLAASVLPRPAWWRSDLLDDDDDRTFFQLKCRSRLQPERFSE